MSDSILKYPKSMGITKAIGNSHQMDRLILPFFLTDMRDVRKEKGVSISEMAKFVGVTSERISSWECCKYQPNLKEQLKIMELLGVWDD